MGIEGHLIIRLEIGRNTVNRVRIESSRPVHASRVFVGKGIAETLHLIPRLFSICATAQACAGVRACEQALGLQVSAKIERLRDLLVNMETLREHLWRILLDWPSFIDSKPEQPAVAEIVAIQREYRQALCPGINPFQPGEVECHAARVELRALLERISSLLQQAVFGMPVTRWLGITGQPTLADWAASKTTIAAVLIDRILKAEWSSVGTCHSVALPPLLDTPLHQAMKKADFVERPQWSGQCCESSSMVRVDSPLLRSLKREHGNGLLTRLVARLSEIALLSEQLLPVNLPGGSDCLGTGRPARNPGIGQTSAARGQLVHRVELAGDRIASYQILAPTEWNFHPQGVVTQALSVLAGDRDQVEKQARLLINAIDPCVGYELHICQGASVDA